MVRPRWNEKVESFWPQGRTPKSSYGIAERYEKPLQSTYTVDQADPDETIQGAKQVAGAVLGVGKALIADDNGVTLEQLDQRLSKMEQAVWQMAKQAMGQGEQQADDNSQQAGAKPDDSSPGFDPPAKSRPGISTVDMRGRRDGTRTLLQRMNDMNKGTRR